MERSSQGQVRCVRKAVRWYRIMSWCLEVVPNCFAVCFCLPYHPLHLPSPHTSLTLLNSFHITSQSFHYPHSPSTPPTLAKLLPKLPKLLSTLSSTLPKLIPTLPLHITPQPFPTFPHSPRWWQGGGLEPKVTSASPDHQRTSQGCHLPGPEERPSVLWRRGRDGPHLEA